MLSSIKWWLRIAAALTLLYHSIAHAALTEHERSRVYVFGDIVVDAELGMERFGPFSSQSVDCSTERFQCISGNILKVSVPRRCSDVELDAYGSGQERMVVLHRASTPSQASWLRERLIGNPDRPYIVYGYTPQLGIQFVVYDVTRQMNLISLAQSGELLELSSGRSTNPAYRNLRRELITYSQLFPCQGQF